MSAARQPFPTGFIVATVIMTTLVQAMTSFAMNVPPVLAPVAAPELGTVPAKVGNLVAVAYIIASTAGLASGPFIVRHGPILTFRICVLGVAIGLAAGAFGGLGWQMLMLLVFAACVGVAHGIINPASSTVLARASPPRLRSLIFSIKQTGVPAGGVVAGALLPFLLLHFMWREVVLVLGIAMLAMLLLLMPFYRVYDREAREAKAAGTLAPQSFSLASVVAPVREVWRRPPIRDMALSSAVYSAVQVAMLTHLISFLKLDLGYTLVAAGLVFSTVSIAGVIGRPVWGALADATRNARGVLAWLGVGMGLCGFVLAFMPEGAPVAAIAVIAALYGATAVGWNGVFLAEVARLSPEGRVSVYTGGAQVYTFSGATAGPAVFGWAATLAGQYWVGFALSGVLGLAMGVRLFWPVAPERR